MSTSKGTCDPACRGDPCMCDECDHVDTNIYVTLGSDERSSTRVKTTRKRKGFASHCVVKHDVLYGIVKAVQ